jgi:hypothetical protein
MFKPKARRESFVQIHLFFMAGAPCVSATSHTDIASQRRVWVSCVAAVDTRGITDTDSGGPAQRLGVKCVASENVLPLLYPTFP